MSMTETEPTDREHLWKPGMSGNPKGRPKGARNKLGEVFIQALHDSFLELGPDAIVRVIEEEPAQYLRVIASLMPKQLEVKETTFSDLSDDELATFLDTVRSHLSLREAPASGNVIEGTAQQVEPVPALPEAESIP